MSQEAVEILLCEDNPGDAELTLHTLKRHNISNNVVWVKDGEEALEFLSCTGRYAGRDASSRPNLVLLDLKMPKVDGIEVLEAIKSDSHLKILPVVILTSSDNEADIARCYELGANSYVSKPVDFQQFADAVRQLGLYWMVVNSRLPA